MLPNQRPDGDTFLRGLVLFLGSFAASWLLALAAWGLMAGEGWVGVAAPVVSTAAGISLGLGMRLRHHRPYEGPPVMTGFFFAGGLELAFIWLVSSLPTGG